MCVVRLAKQRIFCFSCRRDFSRFEKEEKMKTCSLSRCGIKIIIIIDVVVVVLVVVVVFVVIVLVVVCPIPILGQLESKAI